MKRQVEDTVTTDLDNEYAIIASMIEKIMNRLRSTESFLLFDSEVREWKIALSLLEKAFGSINFLIPAYEREIKEENPVNTWARETGLSKNTSSRDVLNVSRV